MKIGTHRKKDTCSTVHACIGVFHVPSEGEQLFDAAASGPCEPLFVSEDHVHEVVPVWSALILAILQHPWCSAVDALAQSLKMEKFCVNVCDCDVASMLHEKALTLTIFLMTTE